MTPVRRGLRVRRPGRYVLPFSFWVRSVQNHRPFSKRLLDNKRKPLPELLAPGRRVDRPHQSQRSPRSPLHGGFRPGRVPELPAAGSFYLKFSFSVN